MNKFILSCLFALSFFAMQGQQTYDLRSCLEIGLKRNYEIQIVLNDQQISDNNASIGNAGYLPTLDLNAGYSGTLNNVEQHPFSGDGIKENGVNNQNLNAGVNLNWTVFDGFNVQATYSKLKELQQIGELNTRYMIENFIAQLSAEYYNFVQQKNRLSNLKYATSLSRERLRIVEERYNIGAMSRLDLQQAKVDFNADSSSLIKQIEVLHVSLTTLNQLMAAENVEIPLNILDTIITFETLLNKDDIWQKTLTSNSSLLILERSKTVQQLNLRIMQSQNYPYLKLNAGYGYSQNRYEIGTLEKQQTLGLNYGITLGFNIFSGFNRNREQKNAKLQVQNSELEYKQQELFLKTNLSNLWMAYQNNMDRTSLEKENLNVAKENYEIAMERYKLGDLSGIELREAQNSLLESEERLLEVSYNTKLSEISLMLISGQVSNYLK